MTPREFRAEAFGAIVQLERPRALVFVDRDYARHFEIDSIVPKPDSEAASRTQIEYAFRGVDGEPLAITLNMRALETTYGQVTGHIEVAGAGQAAFRQWVWP